MSKTLVLLALGVVALAGCGDPKVEVVVPMGIVAVSPTDGATGIDLTAVPTVCFNMDMSAASAQSELVLETSSGTAITGQSVVASGSARCLSIAHTNAFIAGTGYQVHAKLGLPAADGTTTFAADAYSHFTTQQ